MWDVPGPGIEPMSPALAGGFLTTVPPGKSPYDILIYQHDNPMNSVIPILQMRKLRQRELRNWLMVISLKMAAWGFEPRKSNSSNVYSFCSPAQWWMSPGKSSVSEVRKLGWLLALPFISWPFRVERTLSFPMCKMRTSWVDVMSHESAACKSSLWATKQRLERHYEYCLLALLSLRCRLSSFRFDSKHIMGLQGAGINNHLLFCQAGGLLHHHFCYLQTMKTARCWPIGRT